MDIANQNELDLLSIFYKKQTGDATFWSLVVSLCVGVIISISGHFFDAEVLASLGAPIGVAVGLVVSLVVNLTLNKKADIR